MIDESSRYSQEAYSEYDHISLALLLAFLSTRWLFEGIVGGLYAEVALLGLGTASLIVGALRRKLSSLVWLLYCLSILMSLTLHGATTNIALRATLVGMIVVYQLLGVKSVQSYARFTRWLAGVGMIHAGFVLVHCLTGSAFNTAYFPILKSDASELATYYYGRGNFFGLNYYPTDTAFIIACALAVHLLSRKGSTVSGLIRYPIGALLLATLLLTGKKGILICSLTALLISMLIQQQSRRKTIRAAIILALFVGAAYLIRMQAMAHPDNPMFFRLNRFLVQLSEGGELDSERRRLVEEALTLWRANPLWGIGWRRFSGYTMGVFGHARTHEVNCDYVQFLCETGVVGFILMMTPIVVMLRRTAMSLIDLSSYSNLYNQSESQTLIFAAFIQFLVAAYAFIEIPFYDMPIFAIYTISCCIVNAAYYNRRSLLYESNDHISAEAIR